jgi:hypothetical protein
MATILKDKILTAGKEHRCILCGARIELGTQYRRITYAYEGKVEDQILHLECANAIVDYCKDCGEDEWFTSVVMDYVNEKLKEKGIEPARTCRDAILQYSKVY